MARSDKANDIGPDDRQLARVLLEGAGLAEPVSLTLLPHGRNNRTMLASDGRGGERIVKRYCADQNDPHGRIDREFGFLNYANSRAIAGIPVGLFSDREANAGLMSRLPGRPIKPSELARDHIDAACSFLVRVNEKPRRLDQLEPAKDACRSISDHLGLVDRRLRRIGAQQKDDGLGGLIDDIKERWASVSGLVARAADQRGVALDVPLEEDQLCVSPSDFGFHNALIDEGGRLAFFDFEYAGYDDPAKLICDFFCQPDYEMPKEAFPIAVGRLQQALDLDDDFVWRSQLLFPVHALNWVCILLNEFDSEAARRRAFAGATSLAERQPKQRQRATAKLRQFDIWIAAWHDELPPSEGECDGEI